MSLAPWPMALQPWNKIIFPPPPGGLVEAPMSVTRARSIPGVGRALQLIGGLAKQMPLDDVRGEEYLPRPRMLEQPDPDMARGWWVQVQIEDYLINGNALHYVTSYDAEGWPASAMWLPADWCSIIVEPSTSVIGYDYQGTLLDPARVVHVRRGAHRQTPQRGIGVVEQHLESLGRVETEERYSAKALSNSAVPSVAVITSNPNPSQEELDLAKSTWIEKYGGPTREPAILPHGAQVIPLSWSPEDSQMIEARKQSLGDVANMFNLDGYWLGAPAGSFTYRSPGPMYLNLIRQTINPILEDFEGTWSTPWLPRGRVVRFDRLPVLKDDLGSMINYAGAAVKNKLITQSEGRVMIGYSADVPAELKPKPIPPGLAPNAGAGDPDDDTDPEQDDEDQEEDES